MAIYHLNMVALQRSKGRDVTAAAAYRSGEKMLDPRTGNTYDYTKKSEISYKEIVGFSGTRAELWSAVETHHKRGDATPAREVEVALPIELTNDQKIELAQKLATEISTKYNVAVDLCVHKIDSTNPHAHLLMTACSVDLETDKLGKKVEALDPIACSRTKPPTPSPADYLRERWAELTNEVLEKAGHKTRIDHRSLDAQSIDRVAQIHLGKGHHIPNSDRSRINDEIIEYNELKAELKPLERIALKAQKELEAARESVAKEENPTLAPEQQLLTFDEIKDHYEEAKKQRIKHSALTALSENMSELSTEQHRHKADQVFLVHVENVLKSIESNGQKEAFFKLADEDLYQAKPRQHYEILEPLHKAYKQADIEHHHANTSITEKAKKQARINYAKGFNNLFGSHLQRAGELIENGLVATLDAIAELKKEVVQTFGKSELWCDIFNTKIVDDNEKQKQKSVEL